MNKLAATAWHASGRGMRAPPHKPIIYLNKAVVGPLGGHNFRFAEARLAGR